MVWFHSKELEYCESGEKKENLDMFVYSLTRKGKDIYFF